LKKLLKLKAWVTVSEAARYLSILLGENVTDADVLRLALDGRLTLSVYFVNHVEARCGKIFSAEDAQIVEAQDFQDKAVIQMIKERLDLGDDRVFSFSRGIELINGVWDLSMLGAERLEVERKYHSLTSGPPVELIALDGLLVYGPSGTWAHILEHVLEREAYGGIITSPLDHPDNYFPAPEFP
jgi:hypothetical protein